MATVRIGTRGSTLAIHQAEAVMKAARGMEPSNRYETVVIASTGDDNPDAALDSLGIGVFTSSLERALAEKRIDVAVHSLKDLPTAVPDGLRIIPVLPREDARDVLVSRYNHKLLDLPEGSRIGTSSPRRIAQLKRGRKDVLFLPIRGNVETRLIKSEGPDYDGVVLAAAGIRRLGMGERVTEYLSPHICTPAPGQAALAAEVRADDRETIAIMQSLQHRATAAAVTAERELLKAAGGGCQLPIGAFAEVDGNDIRLFATVTPTDGSVSYRVEVTGPASDPDVVGRQAFRELEAQGAGPLMRGARR